MSCYGEVFSSRVNGNLRIIWIFWTTGKVVLDIGGHSGKNKVYR